MKQIEGIWLPDGDEHFAEHLRKGPRFQGDGTYQMKKIELAVGATPENRRGLAVDVGAHVGLWTRVLASHFARVIAFEPVPQFCECWEKNVADARDRCVLARVAVGNVSGQVRVKIEGENSGNTHVVAQTLTEPTRDLEVQVVTLDDCLATKIVDLLKVDVEGYELQVLEGARQTLARCHPVVVIEQKPGNAERYGKNQFDARDYLTKMGATVIWERAGDVCMRWD